jgi:hypothetical protein
MPAQYDDKGRLTRAGAQQVIAEGGTVHLNGVFYGPGTELPSEADFAKGDPKAEAAARERLVEQRKALDAQIAGLDESAKQQQAAEKAAARTAPAAASAK